MLDELMRKRRSIRKFKNEIPDRETLKKLIVAASLAPSASNKQPWRFIIIRDRERIEAAAKAVDAASRRIVGQVERVFSAGFAEYTTHFSWFRQAPALIVPICRHTPMLSQILTKDADPEIVDNALRLENDSVVISISCAIQNILLKAEDIGLGACCLTGPMIAERQLGEIFSIREGWRPIAVLAVGYPDEEPAMPERKAVDAITTWLD